MVFCFKKTWRMTLGVYIDADWAGSIADNRSTSGYSTLLGGNLVIWWSKKQFVIASSNTEAEFGTMVHGLCELLWIKIILSILE